MMTDPMKVPSSKDPREPFSYKDAEDHFMATGQASDEFWSNSQPVEEKRTNIKSIQKAKGY